MRRLLLASLLFGFFATARLTFAGDAPTTAPSSDESALLAKVTPLIGGEWRIKATWAAGNPLEARAIYSWGIGKKFVNAKTFVGTDKGEYQRYESMFGVQDGKLMSWDFVFDGHQHTSTFMIEGNKLSTTRSLGSNKDGEQILHNSIEIVEPNKMHWVATIEQNGQNKPLMDGYWIREASASSN
jgi:hypothetical protein